MSHAPTSTIVGVAWLRLALPTVGVATKLPKADAAQRTVGFVRVQTVGGSPEMYVPRRQPVLAAECWAAPAEGSAKVPTGRANDLAEAIVAATYDTSLMDVAVDLSSFGDYESAHVQTVVALSEPREITDDPGNYGRFDVDLLLSWRPVA